MKPRFLQLVNGADLLRFDDQVTETQSGGAYMHKYTCTDIAHWSNENTCTYTLKLKIKKKEAQCILIGSIILCSRSIFRRIKNKTHNINWCLGLSYSFLCFAVSFAVSYVCDIIFLIYFVIIAENRNILLRNISARVPPRSEVIFGLTTFQFVEEWERQKERINK